MASKVKPEEHPDVLRRTAVLSAEFEKACGARNWERAQVVKRTGLDPGVVAKILSCDLVRAGNYQWLARALGMRLGLVPDLPANSWVAMPDDALLAAVATRLLSAILELKNSLQEDSIVDRRQLGKSLSILLVDGSVPDSVRQLLSEPQCPGLTADEIEALSVHCGEHFRSQYATAGGGAACDAALFMHHQASTWLEQGGYSSSAARALEAFCCDLGAWTGQLAMDAGRERVARHYLVRTIADAEMMGYYEAQAHAWNGMWALLEQKGHPRKSLQAAQAGLNAAELHGNAKMCGVFHLRAARSSASLGDRQRFAVEAAAARELLEQGSRGSSISPWLRSWTTGASSIGKGHLALRQAGPAIAEFQSIIDASSANYHRDVVHATVRMAQCFALQDDLALAGRTVLARLPDVMALSSEEIVGSVRQLRNYLIHRPSLPPQAREFIVAFDEMMLLRGKNHAA